MDNLGDILGNKKYSEPPEIQPLKTYIQDKYSVSATVRVETSRIIIMVPSSALANDLYSNITKLQDICSTDKKIVIRVGS